MLAREYAKAAVVKEASERNAGKRSRAGVGGPKTVKGKRVARFNEVKHGLKAGQLVLVLPDKTEKQHGAERAIAGRAG